ncbi:subtilase-type protease inhibitor [Streptomyces sp. J2-1]|uniref:SSI family serine proteinase inhibitor n=1 Tax=Streptomyces corallincola TaxID=2851888 RepID=UPI001C392A65|nr:SSI family serine proteinase inhibitor [Streptomyces corallincola]MBV2354259.1 subtilase-type protease inhibitor [Streptomyces corallincola]
MTYLTRAAALTGALLLSVGPLTASPAQAAPGDAPPGDWLALTVTRGTGQPGGTGQPTGAAPITGTRGALLLCDPPQGHPHAGEACAELGSADGDFEAIPPRTGTFCPMIFAPVTVHAHGRWSGRTVEFRRTYTNHCVMTRMAGAVFALDAD